MNIVSEELTNIMDLLALVKEEMADTDACESTPHEINKKLAKWNDELLEVVDLIIKL